METAFWCAAGIVAYAYLGYPLLIGLLAWWRPAPAPRRSDDTPSMTAILIVHDEGEHVADKVRNLLSLDYPADQLDVLVVSDGSTDGTDQIVRGLGSPRVKVLALAGPRGKAACLDEAVPQARGEILLLTDARQELARDAARALASYFADPGVGAVSGELHLGAADGAAAKGVGTYWSIEKRIRHAESRFDSTVGVTGALYALRRSLFVPLDPATILDDVALPMEVVLGGGRVLFAPEARAWDRIALDPAHEYRRKVRTLAGNYQLAWLRPRLLNPLRNRLFWQFVSHKLARLLVPWCLLVLLVAGGALAARRSAPYAVMAAAQVFFYSLSAVGGLLAWRRRRLRLTALPYAFVLLNLAAARAFFGFLTRRQTAAWKAAS